MNVKVPVKLWESILWSLQRACFLSGYYRPDEFDDAAHELRYDRSDLRLQLVRERAEGIDVLEKPERFDEILELAKQQAPEEVEFDNDAVVSEGGDNGCYVQGWFWCDFADTELDKNKQDGFED